MKRLLLVIGALAASLSLQAASFTAGPTSDCSGSPSVSFTPSSTTSPIGIDVTGSFSGYAFGGCSLSWTVEDTVDLAAGNYALSSVLDYGGFIYDAGLDLTATTELFDSNPTLLSTATVTDTQGSEGGASFGPVVLSMPGTPFAWGGGMVTLKQTFTMSISDVGGSPYVSLYFPVLSNINPARFSGVPEPGSLALIGGGLALLGGRLLSRKKRQ